MMGAPDESRCTASVPAFADNAVSAALVEAVAVAAVAEPEAVRASVACLLMWHTQLHRRAPKSSALRLSPHSALLQSVLLHCPAEGVVRPYLRIEQAGTIVSTSLVTNLTSYNGPSYSTELPVAWTAVIVATVHFESSRAIRA